MLLLVCFSAANAATCPKGQKATWSGGQKVCEPFTLPENATLNYSGNDWVCKKGFRRTGYGPSATCEKVEIPVNAKLNPYGNDWVCNRGFVRTGYGSTAECKAVIVQANAKLNYSGDGWECTRNHVQRKDACIHASQADDGEIRKLIIGESIAGYPGNCPCPYFADRAGRSCGGRSAYSRAGGYSPLCYPNDVSDQMVANYRKRFKEGKN